MNKYVRWFILRVQDKRILTSSFINTKPKLRTIQPDVRISYNQLFINLKKR